MNRVDSLLLIPFSSMTYKDKLEVLRMGAHQPKDVIIKQQYGDFMRTFSVNWFERKPWLTVSDAKKSIFCFCCLLFEGETAWTKTGISDIKHLSSRIKTHESRMTHMQNVIKFKIFEIKTCAPHGDCLRIKKHNGKVAKNRHILSRIIDCLKFYASHEILSHTEQNLSSNNGILQDLLIYTANFDGILKVHIEDDNFLENTLVTIQNDLLNCMYQVYVDELKSEINQINYVAMRIYGTTDTSGRPQAVIILCYVKDGQPVERFLTFINVENKTYVELVTIIRELLEEFHLKDKLIAHSFDGVAALSGSWFEAEEKLELHYLNTHHMLCYVHYAKLMKRTCLSIKRIRIFFSNINTIIKFFTSSPKQCSLLHEICSKPIPTFSKITFNFDSFIEKFVNIVVENKPEIIDYFHKLNHEDFCDDMKMSESIGIKQFLEDEEFNFLLSFFHKMFRHVCKLYPPMQIDRLDGNIIPNLLKSFKSSVTWMKEDIQYQTLDITFSECNESTDKQAKRARTCDNNMKADAKEAYDLIVNVIDSRIQNQAIFNLYLVVHPKWFKHFSEENRFPTCYISTLLSKYPMIVKSNLCSELKVIYASEPFCRLSNIGELFKFLHCHGLIDTFPEVSKLLEIILMTPLPMSEEEHSVSILSHIESFLKSTGDYKQLKEIGILSIHSEFIAEIVCFNKKVIDKFAQQEERKSEYLYRQEHGQSAKNKHIAEAATYAISTEIIDQNEAQWQENRMHRNAVGKLLPCKQCKDLLQKKKTPFTKKCQRKKQDRDIVCIHRTEPKSGSTLDGLGTPSEISNILTPSTSDGNYYNGGINIEPDLNVAACTTIKTELDINNIFTKTEFIDENFDAPLLHNNKDPLCLEKVDSELYVKLEELDDPMSDLTETENVAEF